jgi:ubiquinone biosynthesis protein
VKPFKALHEAVRAKQILTVLARQGFANLLNQLDLHPGFLKHVLPHPTPRRTAERIRLAAEELGPTFVKLGQMLSMRPDVVPHEIILELRKLQDQVPPLPFDVMRPVLVEGLGCEPSEIFSEFDETPTASASLAQVYIGRLRAGGEPVAVKIQKPGIRQQIETDFDLAEWLAGLLHQRVPALKPVDLPTVMAEARASMLRELDFRLEAQNQEYFNTLNPHPEQVFAPKVYRDACSECVLVMERVVGTSISRAETIPADERRKLAGYGAVSISRQVFISGFFHADPHAGNIFFTGDGRLCFLDWGMAGNLTRRLRYAVADFWVASVEQDTEKIVQIAADLAPVDARPDLRAMERDVTLALREELNFAIGRASLGKAMLRLLFIFGQNGIFLARDYSLMAKAVLSIEEVGVRLDPEFDLRTYVTPVLGELQRERLNPVTLARRTRDVVRQAILGIQDLPFDLRRLLRRLEHDNISINLHHKGLEQHDEAVKIASNRITLGVIIGSLVIGSSLIVTTHIPPYLFGYSALGIVGYLISGVLGLYVIWDIIFHGRHK